MIASAQVTNTEIFAFKALLVFKTEKAKETVKNGVLFKKQQMLRLNYSKIINS